MHDRVRHVKAAYVMLVLSAALFGAMAFTTKLATARLGGAQVAMVRFLIGLVPILFIPAIRKQSFTVQRWDLLFYRGFFGGTAVLLYFMAIAHIPVGVATLLNYTAPIFSGAFAAMFIGERIRPAVLVPLIISFTGIVLVVRSHATGGEMLGFGRWELAGLGSAMLSGIAVTAIRMARRTESSWSIFASFSIFGLLATAPFGIQDWIDPNHGEWTLLALVGLFSIAAQLLMTSALRWVETLSAGVISQLAVVVSMVLGAVWLEEHLLPMTLLGSALTLSGVIAVMAITSRPKPSAFDEAAEQ